jgi:predicted adenylyl cyclase CyaB
MERKRIEIEAKFPLKDLKYTIKKLKEVGVQTEENKFQKDIYFTPAHENFIEKAPISEWLRVRDDGDEQTIIIKIGAIQMVIIKLLVKKLKLA